MLRGDVFEAFRVGQAAIDIWDTVAGATAEFNRNALPQPAASYPILRGKRFVRETFRLKLQKFDGSQLFRQDATFKMVPGPLHPAQELPSVSRKRGRRSVPQGFYLPGRSSQLLISRRIIIGAKVAGNAETTTIDRSLGPRACEIRVRSQHLTTPIY